MEKQEVYDELELKSCRTTIGDLIKELQKYDQEYILDLDDVIESAEKLLPEWKFLEDKLISADLDDGYTSTEFIFEHTSTNKFYGCIVHYSEYEGYEGPFDLYEVEPYSTIAYRRINNDQTDSAVQA